MLNMANEVRKDILTEIHSASSGHPGGALSCADILVAIYFHLIKEGDKVILSKGHASAALYAVLAEKGFFPKEELTTFRKLGSRLQGHPTYHKTPGVDAPSGSLGQGLSIANGLALSFKLDKKDNFVYCIIGDGEAQEGQIWEAAMTASHYKLDNLIVFLDYNKLQIDGKNDDVMKISPIKDKFKAFGFNVYEIDGHNEKEIIDTVNTIKEKKELTSDDSERKPSIIIANTIKGKGVSFMENQASWHGKAPSDEEFEEAMKELE